MIFHLSHICGFLPFLYFFNFLELDKRIFHMSHICVLLYHYELIKMAFRIFWSRESFFTKVSPKMSILWYFIINDLAWYFQVDNQKNDIQIVVEQIFIFYEIILLIWKNIKTIYKGEKVEEEPLIRISDTYNISSINLQEWKNKEKIST